MLRQAQQPATINYEQETINIISLRIKPSSQLQAGSIILLSYNL